MTILDIINHVSQNNILGKLYLNDEQYIATDDSTQLTSSPIHLPYDSISQLFLFCLSILGLYILFCLQQKN